MKKIFATISLLVSFLLPTSVAFADFSQVEGGTLSEFNTDQSVQYGITFPTAQDINFLTLYPDTTSSSYEAKGCNGFGSLSFGRNFFFSPYTASSTIADLGFGTIGTTGFRAIASTTQADGSCVYIPYSTDTGLPAPFHVDTSHVYALAVTYDLYGPRPLYGSSFSVAPEYGRASVYDASGNYIKEDPEIKSYKYSFSSGYPDPVGTTGVVTPIASPAFPPVATTSSPVAVSFYYTIANETDSVYSDYRLEFKNPDTGNVVTRFGHLSDTSVGTHLQATSTALTGDGTWNLFIGLATDGTAGARSYAERASQTFFGLNVVTNTASFQDYVPPQQADYSASSCAVNFLGTFDLPQCIGYLITPTTGSTSPMANLTHLSLAHSFPFAYGYQMGQMRNLLFAQTPSADATSSIAVTVNHFGTITFISKSMIEAVPFAPFIKSALGWVMWLLLIEIVYLTVLRSHNNHTGV